MRQVSQTYSDPLDVVWIETAKRIGLRLERDAAVFAATDGRGQLLIADSDLDKDDCLAQMIFHEMCHSLVAGPEAFSKPDWGLADVDADDVSPEHATLKLQATLAGHFGLRNMLAPTTDFRPYFDDLQAAAIQRAATTVDTMARQGLRRYWKPPWYPYLHEALLATRSIVETSQDFSQGDSLLKLDAASPAPKTHPFGGFAVPEQICGACAWLQDRRCLSFGEDRQPEDQACHRLEEPFTCMTCGACCREAYHSVTLTQEDGTATRHPDLVVVRADYTEMKRNGDRCVALTGDGLGQDFLCTIYNDRPTSCRDFEQGGEHCLTARRRVGLSD